MGGAFVIVWGVALAAIAALGAFLVWTLRRSAQPAPPAAEEAGAAAFVPTRDTLLFYYEEESVRSASQGGVIVRIPGMAWDREWQDDMLRLEVSAQDPASVAVPAEWGAARVLAAYALRAYRITEIGTDIEVERFMAPVDVFLTTEGEGGGLRFGVRSDGGWTLAPTAALSPDAFEGVEIPAGRSWVAASITGLREICLVRLPGEGGERGS